MVKESKAFTKAERGLGAFFSQTREEKKIAPTTYKLRLPRVMARLGKAVIRKTIKNPAAMKVKKG